MPSDYTATARARTVGADVTALVNGDAPNRDNLYVEASPGVKPKLTLGLLLDYLDGFASGVGAFTKLLVGNAAPNPGSEGLGVEGNIATNGTLTVAGASSFSNTITAVIATFSGLVTANAGLRIAGLLEATSDDVSTGNATHTYNPANGPFIWIHNWTHAGHLLDLTLPDIASGSARRHVCFFWFNPTNVGANDGLNVKRADATVIATIVAGGFGAARWDGTVWRTLFAIPFDGNWTTPHATMVP